MYYSAFIINDSIKEERANSDVVGAPFTGAEAQVRGAQHHLHDS